MMNNNDTAAGENNPVIEEFQQPAEEETAPTIGLSNFDLLVFSNLY